MKIFFFAVLLVLGFMSAAQAQANISYPQWQHPVLQQARAGLKTLTVFYNTDTASFITVSIIDNKQKIIYWFDCYGYYFDAVPIGDDNLQAVLKKNITAFKYYDFITTTYIKVIVKARSNLQRNGNAAKFTAHEKQLLQIDDTLKYPSTLKKLIELDNQKISVERQLREFHSANPNKIKFDSVFACTIPLSYGSMQTTWQQQDTTTTYYNRVAITPVFKAVLNHRNATIAYFNRGNQLIDEVQINKESLNLLFSEKTDVFLLYRGWLEMQRFNIVRSIVTIRASEKQFIKAQKNINAAKAVNTKNSYKPLLAYTKDLLKVTDYKINYVTSIDRGFVSQCLRNQYLQISNPVSAEDVSTFTRGNKRYELTDIRGNVMAVVTDKKIQHSSNGTTVDYYEPDIAAVTDYAPFGSALPGRNYQSDTYRYGFNGKENDNEVKGKGNQQDYGMRIYDPRLGRFLSVDPLIREYPELTPYQFASNMPINSIDLDGAEQMEQIRFWITDPKKITKTTGYKEVTLGVAMAVDAALTKGWFSRLIIGSRLAGTQHHNKPVTPKQEQERQQERTDALIDAGMGFGVSRIVGNVIRFGAAGKNDVKYLFRGTSENFQGSAALQKIGITATSSDPAVATIFAITSKNSGQGILQIALPQELQGVVASSNVLASLEKEVALSLKPVQFTARVNTTITADEARGILGKMGIKLPSKISLAEQSNIIRQTPKLNASQIDDFYKKVVELKAK